MLSSISQSAAEIHCAKLSLTVESDGGPSTPSVVAGAKEPVVAWNPGDGAGQFQVDDPGGGQRQALLSVLSPTCPAKLLIP